MAGRPVRRPDLTIATEDHNTPTLAIDKPIADLTSRIQIETLRSNAAEFGIRLHSLGDKEQGIVHVVGPQLGLTQPGITVVCGDSHTSTHGAFGAMAFGIGTSEVEHVLATQTLPLKPFKTMAINVEGTLRPGVTAKDIILAVIAKIGTGGGQGYVLEYRGSAIRALSMDGRMTICNMSIEAGARAGMVAPDETTYEYLRGPRRTRPRATTGTTAIAYWQTLATDEGAEFDAEVSIDADTLEPFVTWGTNPGSGRLALRCGARPRDHRGPARARRRRARARVHGPRGRHAAEGHPGRRRLHGLVHEQPHRRPPRVRLDHQGQAEGRGRARHGRARLGARATRGRGRGARQGHRGVRCRVALRGLLDVPRHEPRPARPGRALRLDEQPQLRGPAGQGRPHPPRLAARRGGHRDPRHALEPVGPGSRYGPRGHATGAGSIIEGQAR